MALLRYPNDYFMLIVAFNVSFNCSTFVRSVIVFFLLFGNGSTYVS